MGGRGVIDFDPSHCDDCADNFAAIVSHLDAHTLVAIAPAQSAEGFRATRRIRCRCGARAETRVAHHRHVAYIFLTLATNYPPHPPEGDQVSQESRYVDR